jgi:hypothetical protein
VDWASDSVFGVWGVWVWDGGGGIDFSVSGFIGWSWGSGTSDLGWVFWGFFSGKGSFLGIGFVNGRVSRLISTSFCDASQGMFLELPSFLLSSFEYQRLPLLQPASPCSSLDYFRDLLDVDRIRFSRRDCSSSSSSFPNTSFGVPS